MRSRSIVALICLFFGLVQGTISRELFDAGKAPMLIKGQYVYPDDLVGGYQIYGGNGFWQFEDASISLSGGSADSIPIGVIRMTHWDEGDLAATQIVAANLRQNNGAYWSGAPCDGDNLVKKNKGRGRYDDCMNISVASIPVGSKQVTFLVVKTVQSQSSGRYYNGTLGVNVAYLGFPGTAAIDWNKYSVETNSAKAAVLAKLTNWAERYQEAVSAQMDYGRPADTFSLVPKLQDLKAKKEREIAAAPKKSVNRGTSYVFCESTKTMVEEDKNECPN